jgi:hypothetical protein
MAKAPEKAPMEPGKVIRSDERNADIWNALRTPDPAYTKKFDRPGFKGTAMTPTYLYRRATEVFGPAGKGWGYDIDKIFMVPAENPKVVYVQVTVWYLWPESDDRFGNCHIGKVTHVGGNVLERFRKINGETRAVGYDDEAVKAAVTDAVGKALSLIGMGADVYMGLFDDNKYVREASDIFDETDLERPSQQGALTKLAEEKRDDRADEEKAPPPEDPAEALAKEQKAWAIRMVQKIRGVAVSAAGYDELMALRGEGKQAQEKWGSDNPEVVTVRAAMTQRRRELEDALGLE